jgi:hypothetical protein
MKPYVAMLKPMGCQREYVGAEGRAMTDRVIIPLPGIGSLELTREAYEAALRPLSAQKANQCSEPPTELVTAKKLAATLSLPISCIYEYAKAGRIPAVRAGKHLRFSVARSARCASNNWWANSWSFLTH